MNIFRLTGDLSHLAAIVILLLKIWKTRSCAGERPPGRGARGKSARIRPIRPTHSSLGGSEACAGLAMARHTHFGLPGGQQNLSRVQTGWGVRRSSGPPRSALGPLANLIRSGSESASVTAPESCCI